MPFLPAPPDVVHAYTVPLEQAIIRLRFRVRDGTCISADELHEYLDALHNVPIMLRDYGGWIVEQNIDEYLARCDRRWVGRTGSDRRVSLIDLLQRARRGGFDRSKAGGSGG